MQFKHVTNAGTEQVPSGRFTDVWTLHGYSRFPGHLSEDQIRHKLAMWAKGYAI